MDYTYYEWGIQTHSKEILSKTTLGYYFLLQRSKDDNIVKVWGTGMSDIVGDSLNQVNKIRTVPVLI